MIRCAWARRRLPQIPDRAPGGRSAAHIATCLRCQAEAGRYRSLHRHLGSLRQELVAAPADLSGRVMTGIDAPLPAARGRRFEWVAAGAAALIGIAVIGLRLRDHAARV